MGSATPSQLGDSEHKGIAAGGRPGPASKTKDSRVGGVRASEGTKPCTRPSFATKNVFDVLQDLSESIGGSPGPQLDAADGQPEPIVHDLHQSLVELLEWPEILSLHAVRRVGRERQLHLKVRALCGEVEKVFDVLVDTGAQVSLVKAGLLPPECLTDSRKPVRLKVANGQYMVGGTKEAAIGLQFVNHRELSRPDLGKEILLQGRFYEAEMDWDMIVRYDFMMETDSGVLPAQASMTLYKDDHLSWLSSPEHHVECQWIHPERNQLEVAALGTEPTGPANQEYGVMPEVASRVVADLRASDLALDAFSSGISAHLRVCEKYWSAQDSAWKKHWGPHQGLMWIHCPRWDIPRAVANIRKDRSKAVLVVPMGCTEEERARDWVVSLANMTLNKVVLPAGESVYQDAKGQPMPPQRWPTEFHYVDGGLEQADTTDFVCVNRIIAEPWRQCFAVSPVDIGESEDPLTEEELDLVQGYMDQPFHDWGNQREGKGQDKAWWEVDSIVSGSYDGNTFVKRVLDHMSSQDEPTGGNPPTYGDLFRGNTRETSRALFDFELNKKEKQCVDQDPQQNHRFHDSSKQHYQKVHAVQRFPQVRQTIRFRPLFCLETLVSYHQDLHWHSFSLLVTILHDAPFLLQLLLKFENTDVKTPDYFEVQDTKAEWKTMNLTSLKKKLPSTVRMLSTNSSKVHDLRNPSVPPSLSKEGFKDLNGFTTHIFTTGSQHAFLPSYLEE